MTLFVNFPVALIVWVIFAIAYQQVENYVIQPQIQRRAVEVEPFVVLVAVLFGATLFGIIGRAACDPGGGLDPDRDPGVDGVPARGGASAGPGRRSELKRPRGTGGPTGCLSASRPRLSGRVDLSSPPKFTT